MRDWADAERLWSDFTAALGTSANFTVVRLGDTAELADELVALVPSGKKRATTTLERDYVTSAGTVPKPGNFSIVIDGKNNPRCIIRIIGVDVKVLRTVGEGFARVEGGGDQSLTWWRAAHCAISRDEAPAKVFQSTTIPKWSSKEDLRSYGRSNLLISASTVNR